MKQLTVRGWNAKALLLECLLLSALIASCGGQEEPLTLDLKSSPILATETPRGDGGIRFAVAPVISPEKGFAPYRLWRRAAT